MGEALGLFGDHLDGFHFRSEAREMAILICGNKTVVEVSTFKTGKHGHAKCHFVAIDIFTAKKLESLRISSPLPTIVIIYGKKVPISVTGTNHSSKEEK